jgi:hypothetical protein
MAPFDVNKWYKYQYLKEAGEEIQGSVGKAINNAIPEDYSAKELAKDIAYILKEVYGSHNFGPFMEVLHAELGIGESVTETKNEYHPDSPEALSSATAKAKEILEKHKSSIKKIADKYEGQPKKSREMQDELNALIDADLKGVPFEEYVSDRVRGTLGKALFRYYASQNPELSKIMK